MRQEVNYSDLQCKVQEHVKFKHLLNYGRANTARSTLYYYLDKKTKYFNDISSAVTYLSTHPPRQKPACVPAAAHPEPPVKKKKKYKESRKTLHKFTSSSKIR